MRENAGFGAERMARLVDGAYWIGRGYIDKYSPIAKTDEEYAIDSYYAMRVELGYIGYDPSVELWPDVPFSIADMGLRGKQSASMRTENAFYLEADTAGCNGKGWTEGKCYTLNTIDRPAICAGFLDNGAKAYGIGYAVEQSPTLTSQKHDAMVLCLNDKGGSVMGISENVSGTLRAQEHGHQPTILDMAHACDVIRDCVGTSLSLQTRMGTGGNQVPLVAYGIGNGQVNEAATPAFEKAQTLNTMHDAQAVFCAAVDCRNGTENTDVNGTLQAKSNGGTSYNLQNVVRENMLVRRLTPLECERLQGFPGGWTDIGDWVDSKGKKRQTTDAARYKALGNSIALLPWRWVLKRLSAQYERDATMASLFDGIGGFPLIWEQLNRRGSCLWASEIDEFPIAVAKYHFGED